MEENKILENQKRIEEKIDSIIDTQEKILKEVLHEEKNIKAEEKIIRKEEGEIEGEEVEIEEKEKQIESLIKSKVLSRRFNDVTEWKTYIWENCEYKTSKEEQQRIVFFCRKLNGSCNYTTCPRNIV